MKILILGGTGAIGSHLVKILSDNKTKTVVTSRKKRESKPYTKYIQGNAHNLIFLENILSEHWDVVIDFMVYTTPEFEQRANTFLASTNQYIFISSCRIYADSGKPITETSRKLIDTVKDENFLSTDEYALAKSRQENILKDYDKNNWTIIRPYIAYSEERLQLGVFEKEEWLYRSLHNRTIIFSEDINQKITTITYGLDVAKCIMSLIGKSEALGNTFNVVAQESMPWKKILSIYLSILEKNLGYKPKIILKNLKEFKKIHDREYQLIYDRLFNRRFDNSKISQHFNTNEFTPIESGLKKCLTEFLRNPKFKNINWKVEAKKDYITKERTPLREIRGIKQKIKYLIFRSNILNKII